MLVIIKILTFDRVTFQWNQNELLDVALSAFLGHFRPISRFYSLVLNPVILKPL